MSLYASSLERSENRNSLIFNYVSRDSTRANKKFWKLCWGARISVSFREYPHQVVWWLESQARKSPDLCLLAFYFIFQPSSGPVLKRNLVENKFLIAFYDVVPMTWIANLKQILMSLYSSIFFRIQSRHHRV